MDCNDLCFVCGGGEGGGLSSAYMELSDCDGSGRTVATVVIGLITEFKVENKEINTDFICLSCHLHLVQYNDLFNKLKQVKNTILQLYTIGAKIFSDKRLKKTSTIDKQQPSKSKTTTANANVNVYEEDSDGEVPGFDPAVSISFCLV